MKTLILFLLAIGSGFAGIAQQRPDLNKLKSAGEKITAWHEYCNELLGSSDYNAVADAAKTGIAISPNDSLRAKAMFSLFAGLAYENLKNYPEAENYLNFVAETAKKINHHNYLVLALTRLDNIYSYTNNTTLRKQVINQLKLIGDTTSNQKTKYELYNVLGGYYRDINNYDSSITFRLQSIDLYKNLLKEKVVEDTINLGYAYTNLGNMFNEIGQYNKALEYLNEGANIIGDKALTGNEETLYLYLMASYKGLQNEDSLLKYYHLTNQRMANRDTLFNVLTQANHILGDFYSGKGNPGKASQYASLAYRYGKKSPDADGRIQANTLYANLLYKSGKYNDALTVLRDIQKEDLEWDKQLLSNIHKTLSDCYANLHQWDSAYFYQNLYSEASSAILQATANKNIADAEAIYQNKEKRLLIEAKNLELKNAARQRFWLVLGLSLVALSALLLFVIYRNKKRTANILDEKNKQLSQLNNELNEANRTKAKLFSIIGHDLRSPINQVYQFLKLQQLNPNALNDEQKTQLNSKIQSAAGSLLDTMEDLLLWSKTQMDAFKTQIQPVNIASIITTCQNLLQLNSDAKNLHYQTELPGELIVRTDANYLQTIVRNLLQNAIKISPDSVSINISAKQENGRVEIAIQNEGGSFTQQQYEQVIHQQQNTISLSGLGLHLVHELAEKIGGEIHFSNPAENITIATISILVS
ncbi:MAG: tetratricopeptide repeat-containing sensor histidine kinase [Chitinophagaceae bacterium]